ncbi:MAG: hypothetical protein U0800_24980 [Isosphaeraceae bacterium]
MRRIAQGLVVMGLALVMASPVLAQQGKGQRKGQGGGGPGGFGQGGMMGMGMGGPLNLLTNSGVQKELKLTDEQVSKAEAAQAEQREQNRERMQGLQNASPEERRESMAKVQASALKAAEGILKPEQLKRFEQIRIQSLGVAAFNDEKVVKALKINDDQKEKFRGIQQASMEEMRGQFQPGGGGDPQAAMAKMQEMRKSSFDKAVAVLSSEQKAAWKELTGDPFEVKFEMPRRRPGN